MKKSQLAGTPIMYIITILVVALIFMFGYKYLTQTTDNIEKINLELLKKSIKEDINEI